MLARPYEGHSTRPGEADDPARRASRVEDQLTAIAAVGRAVSEGEALEDTLETISRTAAALARASAAAIILRRDESASGLAVAGSHGLSERYTRQLNRVRPIEVGRGPSGVAAATGEPVTVADVLADPIVEPWRGLAVREHYRALASVPLLLGGERRVIGVLNAYRRTPGEWSSEQIDLLLTLADHAAIAIQTARLLDESRRQVRGLSLVVRSLRTQSHEHSNLVHAISGLLAIGEVDEAMGLLTSADARNRRAGATIADAIENAVVSGFLVAEAVTAGNRGLDLRVTRASRLRALPVALSELDAITILGNLVHNAIEAVSEMPPARRRISVQLSDRGGVLLIRVRDWGPGIPPQDAAPIWTSGYSTKDEHAGIGLALVASIVSRARGDCTVEQPRGPGAAVAIRIPFE